MGARSISEAKRVRYLLGLDSRAERERIESEFFANDDVFQELLEAEDDLFDAYARGDLTDEERRRFENGFGKSQRERTLFARAFVDTLSPAGPVETRVPGTLPGSFKVFPASRLLQSATIAMVLVLVAVVAWLVTDRGRMSNEIRDLRAESAELRKQTEALLTNSDTEQRRTAELIAPPINLQPHPYKPKPRERRPVTTQPAPQLLELKREEIEMFRVVTTGEVEPLVNRDDATMGSTFVNKVITQLPLNANNVPGLLTLQTATTRDGYVAGTRDDQSSLTLDGVDINLFSPYHLIPLNTSGETTILIPRSVSWIRFNLTLNTAAIHEEYRLTIKSADDSPITSVDWIEPLTPNQTSIDTPVITTGELLPGDYVLSLMGKDTDGSFFKVADYLFKVINLR